MNGDEILFPYFETGKMYNGMEPGREYTLEELGITYGHKPFGLYTAPRNQIINPNSMTDKFTEVTTENKNRTQHCDGNRLIAGWGSGTQTDAPGDG